MNDTVTVKIPVSEELRKAIAAYLDGNYESGHSATDKEISDYVLTLWEADNHDLLFMYFAYRRQHNERNYQE
jgi:hypothetical protein